MNTASSDIGLPTSAQIAVIGAGTMGAGIAQIAAQCGHSVWLYDNRPEAATDAITGIAERLQKRVDKGRQSAEERQETLSLLHASATLSDLADSDLVIEAIIEDLSIKQQVFKQLEQLCNAQTLFATNTSSLSVTEIAANLQDPGRMVGMHFFNPAPVMKLCEIVTGLESRPEAISTITATARAWGKVAVQVASTPGFIVNRVARPFYTEAMRVYEEGGADVVTIDTIMKKAGKFPMGPFTLTDLIGQDVNYAVSLSVFNSYYQDRRFEPSLVQKELVDAGHLGRKSGRGFYQYTDDSAEPIAAGIPASENTRLAAVDVAGDPGNWAGLLDRFEAAGISINHKGGSGPGTLWVENICLRLSDGRSATSIAESTGHSDQVVFDLAYDYQETDTLAVAAADQASASALTVASTLFHKLGITLYKLDDIPGLMVLRTVCMLTNLAADAVHKGVCSAQDADAAMESGTGYPCGPIAWGRHIGFANIRITLLHLEQSYGDGRYRPSPWLSRHPTTRSHAQ